ncbi:hypothetical protein ACTHGU_14670 [Chitinophagaceae bacterium MMS25-I14]
MIARIITILCCCLCGPALYGQSMSVLGSPSAIQITSAAEVINGKYLDHNSISITYPLLNLSGLSMELYAHAEFANLTSPASNTIPASSIGLQVTNLSGADPERFLTTTDQRLLHQPPGLLTSLLGGTSTVTLRYRVLGGTQLLKPAGVYTVRVFYRVVMD